MLVVLKDLVFFNLLDIQCQGFHKKRGLVFVKGCFWRVLGAVKLGVGCGSRILWFVGQVWHCMWHFLGAANIGLLWELAKKKVYIVFFCCLYWSKIILKSVFCGYYCLWAVYLGCLGVFGGYIGHYG